MGNAHPTSCSLSGNPHRKRRIYPLTQVISPRKNRARSRLLSKLNIYLVIPKILFYLPLPKITTLKVLIAIAASNTKE